MATQAAAAAPGALQPLLPYLVSGGSAVFLGVSIVFRSLIHLISSTSRSILFFSPLPIALYFFAPAFVFLQIVANILIVLPYRITLSVLDILYPLYVFFGVACITGTLVGLSGRLITELLIQAAYVDHTRIRKVETVKKGKRARVKIEPEFEDQ
jgi:hypothetical protein